MKTENKNAQFEQLLAKECRENLRKDIDVDRYVRVTLDELWSDNVYEDEFGNKYHYEIRWMDTWHGRPHIVSL